MSPAILLMNARIVLFSGNMNTQFSVIILSDIIAIACPWAIVPTEMLLGSGYINDISAVYTREVWRDRPRRTSTIVLTPVFVYMLVSFQKGDKAGK